MYQAHVEIRSQHSRGSSANRFGGPDTYVSVQCVPDGVCPLTYLNRKVAKKRNIILIYCGEGYRKNDGPKSMLGQAIAKAEKVAAEINNGKDPLKV